MPLDSAALVWFRCDLRSTDHAALHAASSAYGAVHRAFVFDIEILDALPTRSDRRVEFIWESIRELKAALEARGGGLYVLHGRARAEVPRLARRLGAAAVYANRDYEPAAIARDEHVARELERGGIAWRTRMDQVIFECEEVRTRAGGDFSVFTFYKRAWLAKLALSYVKPHPDGRYASRLARARGARLPTLETIGLARTDLAQLAIPTGMTGGARLFADFKRRIDHYHVQRDYPALRGTSHLSLHLRFGTVSIRKLAGYAWRRGNPGAQAWLSELIWREFYFMILASRPDVVTHAFRREYDALGFDDDALRWQAWCACRRALCTRPGPWGLSSSGPPTA